VIVDVIDSSSALRRLRIAARAACALLGNKKSQVRDFAGVSDWESAPPPPLLEGEQYVVFLHAGEERHWAKVAKRVFEIERENGPVWLCTYSGGAGPEAEFAVGDVAPDGVRWRHASEVLSEWDYDDDKQKAASLVGVESSKPPVEVIVNVALGRTQERARNLEKNTAVSSGDEGLRHVLVNAVGPLLAALSFAQRSGAPSPDIVELWRLAKQRLQAFEKMPEWISDLTASCDAEVLPRVGAGDAKALEDLTEVLRRIDGYARSLSASRPAVQDIVLETNAAPVRVLWIEDETAWFQSLAPLFQEFGLEATMSAEPRETLAHAESVCAYDAIVLDLILEGKREQILSLYKHYNIAADGAENLPEGIALLKLLQSLPLRPPVFILSALDTAWTVRACTVYGAADYFVKGANDEIHLMTRIRMEAAAARARRDRIAAPINPMIVVGRSFDPLARLLPVIERAVAGSSTNPLLFVGEPGVGKRELAREAHARSGRRGAPFVSINCTGLNGPNAEGELFGVPRGIAPGAVRDVPGHIEQARGGVLYFDKFDLLPANLRGRVLGFAESGSFRRVGETRERQSDALCIFGVSVAGGDAEGRLGEMFGGIAPLELRVPNLRERVQALPQLADALVIRAARQYGVVPLAVGPDALQVLNAMTLSSAFDGANGNIRGLLNLLQKAIMFANDDAEEIGRDLLAVVRERGTPSGGAPEELNSAMTRTARITADALAAQGRAKLKVVVDRFEAMLVMEFIARVGRPETAKFFDMTDANFRKRIEKYRDKGLIT